MELNIFSFLKNITVTQYYKVITFLFIIMLISLFFAKEIYSAEGILQILIIFIGILYLIVSILNYVKGLMIAPSNWKNEFMSFYYCMWLLIYIFGLLFLVYIFISKIAGE